MDNFGFETKFLVLRWWNCSRWLVLREFRIRVEKRTRKILKNFEFLNLPFTTRVASRIQPKHQKTLQTSTIHKFLYLEFTFKKELLRNTALISFFNFYFLRICRMKPNTKTGWNRKLPIFLYKCVTVFTKIQK